MLFSLLPFGYFGPSNWKVLLIVWGVAIVVASMFCWLIIYAAGF